MSELSVVPSVIRILLVCVIISAAYMISTRNLLSLVSMYSLQSLTLAGMAVALYALEPSPVLIGIAVVTLVSKAVVIPYFIAAIQERIRIKRDIDFHYLSPTSSLVLSLALVLVVYQALSRVMQGTPVRENLLFFGAVIGLSLMLMGLMVMLSRKRAITKVLGFLSMENGVLLFGMFVTELPFIIEFLIIIDLIILVLLTTILTVGIDSTLEDYHKRLHRVRLLQGGGEQP